MHIERVRNDGRTRMAPRTFDFWFCMSRWSGDGPARGPSKVPLRFPGATDQTVPQDHIGFCAGKMRVRGAASWCVVKVSMTVVY